MVSLLLRQPITIQLRMFKNTIFTIDFLFWHGILCLLRVNKSLKSHQFSYILSLIAFTSDFQLRDEPVNQSALHYYFHSIVCEINWKCRSSWVLCCRSWPGRWVISKSSLNLSSCPFFRVETSNISWQFRCVL